MSTAVKIENLSKEYLIRHKEKVAYSTLRESITNRFRNLGKSSGSNKKETFLALDDVSFEIKEGERVGVIGRNGAGKSTLLKLLSRITTPTKGRITINGSVASLLEVGTGFHPELTGRENIYLSGAVMGMKRPQIKSRFDEIVAFSEVEKFLDTPVKRYSSGMYVKLAFSVAAHLNPDILIVDEVLAVGDAKFQQKCLGKMEEVSTESGRTIIFVSHNMQLVQKLCNRGVLLQQGKLLEQGNIGQIINTYLSSKDELAAKFDYPLPESADKVKGFAEKVEIVDKSGNLLPEIPVGDQWNIKVTFHLNADLEHFVAGLGIVSSLEVPVQTVWSKPQKLKRGKYQATFSNKDIYLAPGTYKIITGLSDFEDTFHYVDNVAKLNISEVVNYSEKERLINTKSGILMNQMDVSFNQL